MITWEISSEHCHRCGRLGVTVVRRTGQNKRALCASCLPLDGADIGTTRVEVDAPQRRITGMFLWGIGIGVIVGIIASRLFS